MFSPKLVCITIAVCLSAFFNLGGAWENPGDAMPSPATCFNCTICQYPCHPPSPPASNIPSFGAPPPPSPPALPGYPADIVPPPPPPSPPSPSQGKCPPTPIQCCQYTPPPPSGVYVPYNYALPCSFPNFLLYVIMMLLFSSAVSFWSLHGNGNCNEIQVVGNNFLIIIIISYFTPVKLLL